MRLDEEDGAACSVWLYFPPAAWRRPFQPISGAIPADERRETDDERQDPDDDDEELGARGRHETGVADRATDGDVAVDADGDQVVDGRRAHPDVDRQPDAAPRRAKRPVMKHLPTHATPTAYRVGQTSKMLILSE